jgi:hypothetical protein
MQYCISPLSRGFKVAKVTYQFIRVHDTELKLLDAFEANSTVAKVFRRHTERGSAGLAGVGKTSPASHIDVIRRVRGT